VSGEFLNSAKKEYFLHAVKIHIAFFVEGS